MVFVLMTVELSVGVNHLIPGPWCHEPDSLTRLPRITSGILGLHGARMAEHGHGEHYARTFRGQ